MDESIATLLAGLAERRALMERVEQRRLNPGDWPVLRALFVEDIERLERLEAILQAGGELPDDEDGWDREPGAEEATE